MHKLTRLDWIARVGFLARALVYCMLGYIALASRPRADEAQNAVFESLREMPGGSLMLMATGIGLFAYALFRLYTAFLDLDHKGQGLKGLAKRAGQLFSAIGHAVLGFTAFQFISRLKDSKPTDQASQDTAQTVLDLPLGTLVLAGVGVYFLITAGGQALKAWKASFMKELEPGAPALTRPIGRIGHAARAVVFAVIGWSFVRSAWLEDEDQARSIGGALSALRDNEWLYVAVAVGLILFGVFSLILVRWRIVPRIDVVDTAKRKAEEVSAPKDAAPLY